MRYLAPVEGALRAAVVTPSIAQIDKFRKDARTRRPRPHQSDGADAPRRHAGGGVRRPLFVFDGGASLTATPQTVHRWRQFTQGDIRARQTDLGSSWTEHLERRESVHRLARCRLERSRETGGRTGGQGIAGREARAAHRVHLGVEARHSHAVADPRHHRPHVAARRTQLAAQRAALRRAAGTRQGTDGGGARRGPGEDLAPQLRHPATGARAR